MVTREFWELCKANNICYSAVFNKWLPLPKPSECTFEDHVFDTPVVVGNYCQCHFAVAFSSTQYKSMMNEKPKIVVAKDDWTKNIRRVCENILKDRWIAPACGNSPLTLDYWSSQTPWSVAELEAELQAMVTESNAWRQD